MKTLVGILLLMTGIANASIEKYSLGVGAGNTHPFAEDNFKNSASSGNSYHYWLGYRLTPSFGVELSHDALDFDQLNSSSKALTLSAVFHLNPESKIHPFAKLGLGAAEHTFHSAALDKKSGFALRGDVGLNFELCKYLDLQTGFNYQAYDKVTDSLKNAQALNPYIAAVLKIGLLDDSQPSHKTESKAEPTKSATDSSAQAAVTVDSDHDGVPDADDKCANTPAGTKVNQYGCSFSEKVEITINVNFAPGKSEITPSTVGEVGKLAEFMKKYKETSVVVSGHTDSTGSRKLNVAVSEARAKAVRSELIKLGVEESRITAKGFGPDQPIADNKTPAGRTANRRVVAEIKAEVESKGK